MPFSVTAITGRGILQIRGNILKSFLLTAACLLLSACAFSPQKANIAPTVAITQSDIGSGVTVAVHVVDERPSKTLGRRGNAHGAAAEITAAQDLSVVVHQHVVDALEKKGFATADYDRTAPNRLAVEIRLLEYSTSLGFWTGGVQVQGTLKAVASNNGEQFDKMYRSDEEKRVMVVPTADENEQWINAALSDVLNQMLNDDELIKFLAG